MKTALTPAALAFVITAAFVGSAVMLTFVGIPSSNRDLIAVVIGALAGSFGTIVKFYFGEPAQRHPAPEPPPPLSDIDGRGGASARRKPADLDGRGGKA